jgi:hypothetical protein
MESRMANEYRHTQSATAMLVGLGLIITFVLALCAWIGISVPNARWPLALVAIATAGDALAPTIPKACSGR